MLKNILVILVSFGVFGFALMPWESSIMRKEQQAGLLPTDDLKGDDALDQQMAMISLGGLRSLVAAFLSLEAFESFQRGDWNNVERRYRQIVTLAPHTAFYWDTGAWHLAYNAASAILRDDHNQNLPMVERRRLYKDYIGKGKNFLRKGAAVNPSDWLIQSRLGNILSDTKRYPNYQEAADAYSRARVLGAPPIISRQQFYALARIPDKAHEAWEMGRELYKDPVNRLPSMATTLFALQNRLNPPENEKIPFRELFPSDKLAKVSFINQLSNGLGYPTDGIREALDALPEAPTSGNKEAKK